jgi:hypothetical protein
VACDTPGRVFAALNGKSPVVSSSDHNASLPGSMMGQLMQLRSEGGNTRLLVDVNGRKVEISVLSPIGPDGASAAAAP